MDKKAKVLQHLIEHGSITQMEAWDKFRYSRLSAAIFRLKAEGWPIRSVWESDGKGTRWTRVPSAAATL